jgi:hypothetical protein
MDFYFLSRLRYITEDDAQSHLLGQSAALVFPHPKLHPATVMAMAISYDWLFQWGYAFQPFLWV